MQCDLEDMLYEVSKQASNVLNFSLGASQVCWQIFGLDPTTIIPQTNNPWGKEHKEDLVTSPHAYHNICLQCGFVYHVVCW
jgi:hypothetical protein